MHTHNVSYSDLVSYTCTSKFSACIGGVYVHQCFYIAEKVVIRGVTVYILHGPWILGYYWICACMMNTVTVKVTQSACRLI